MLEGDRRFCHRTSFIIDTFSSSHCHSFELAAATTAQRSGAKTLMTIRDRRAPGERFLVECRESNKSNCAPVTSLSDPRLQMRPRSHERTNTTCDSQYDLRVVKGVWQKYVHVSIPADPSVFLATSSLGLYAAVVLRDTLHVPNSNLRGHARALDRPSLTSCTPAFDQETLGFLSWDMLPTDPRRLTVCGDEKPRMPGVPVNPIGDDRLAFCVVQSHWD
jgi:hypothetical protein